MPGWNTADANIEGGLHYTGGGYLIATRDRHGDHVFGNDRPAPQPPRHVATRRAATTAPATPVGGFDVVGIALPFDEVFTVDDGRRCVVTRDTDWVTPDFVVLKREHSAILGNGTITETASGCHFRGTVDRHFAHDVDNRYELSAAIHIMRTHPIGNGIYHVDVAGIDEVSLVRHGRFGHRAIAAVTAQR